MNESFEEVDREIREAFSKGTKVAVKGFVIAVFLFLALAIGVGL